MKKLYFRIINDVFTVSVITWAVYVASELIKPGLVTNYFNLNLFLLWCVLIGIIQMLEVRS